MQKNGKRETIHHNGVFVFNVLTAADHPESRTVEFTKGPNDSLGISIAGGVGSPLGDIPIFIAMMNPNGLAAQTQLKVKASKALRWSISSECLALWDFFNVNNLIYAPQCHSSSLCSVGESQRPPKVKQWPS